jgi:hypothetical protein
MGDIILLQNLRRKRAYLQGQIEAKECQLGCLREDLETIDRMLRLLDAGSDPTAIKGVRRYLRLDGFSQGDITRLTFEALRDAKEPMAMPELATAIGNRKGWSDCPELRSRLRSTLGRLVKEGRLKKIGKPRNVRWAAP